MNNQKYEGPQKNPWNHPFWKNNLDTSVKSKKWPMQNQHVLFIQKMIMMMSFFSAK